MVRPDLRLLGQALQPSGFEAWETATGVVFVRDGSRAGVYERVSPSLVGRRREGLSLTISVSLVQNPELHHVGLSEFATVDELVPGGPSGKVTFESADSMDAWVRRAARVLPERVRALADEKGDALLATVGPARDKARRLYETLIHPAQRSGSFPEELELRLSGHQRDHVEAVLTRPLIVHPAYEEECRAVVQAWVLGGDKDFDPAQLGAPAEPPPDPVYWKLRLLLDLVLKTGSGGNAHLPTG